MYRDLSKNAPVEVDHILADLVERGHKLGVVSPLLEAARVNLKMHEARLNAR
jgi:ketopantoate reductase